MIRGCCADLFVPRKCSASCKMESNDGNGKPFKDLDEAEEAWYAAMKKQNAEYPDCQPFSEKVTDCLAVKVCKWRPELCGTFA